MVMCDTHHILWGEKLFHLLFSFFLLILYYDMLSIFNFRRIIKMHREVFRKRRIGHSKWRRLEYKLDRINHILELLRTIGSIFGFICTALVLLKVFGII